MYDYGEHRMAGVDPRLEMFDAYADDHAVVVLYREGNETYCYAAGRQPADQLPPAKAQLLIKGSPAMGDQIVAGKIVSAGRPLGLAVTL